ncbi:hypothetical protein ACFQ4U_07000 [Micrococcus antarcticus]|uniref:hypothetical protein n=1 Tax=Glutamicibacter sp. 2E12 TaxID=3416181 RepID=UPI003640DA30
MQPSERWPVLGELCRAAEQIGSLELRLFGSALYSISPSDLDVLVLYDNPAKLNALVKADLWEMYVPPIDLIGMTHDEDFELKFTAGTGATPLSGRRHYRLVATSTTATDQSAPEGAERTIA